MVTIIILLILAGISISLIAGGDGILGKVSGALEANDEANATEKIEMKITYFNVTSYGENTRKANLQELAEGMFQDKEIEYVKIKGNKVASLDKIDVAGEKSIFVKLKEYPYEFEIGSDLQLASVDGVGVTTVDNDSTLILNVTYSDIFETYNNYINASREIVIQKNNNIIRFGLITENTNLVPSGSWITLGVLKPEYRPVVDISEFGSTGNVKYPTMWKIEEDGTIMVYQNSGDRQQCAVNFIYFVK